MFRKFFWICFLLIVFTKSALGRLIQVGHGAEYTSLKEAVIAARSGDSIWVSKGTYYENSIELRKPLSIFGEDFPIIDGRGENEILTIFSDNVLIQGLQFQNVGVSFLKDRAAIRLVESKHVRIDGNILRNTFFGIYLQKSDSCQILNNQIIGEATEETSAGNAIHIWKGKDIRIENNEMSHHRDGLYFEFVNNSSITNNVCKNNLRYGLHFMFSNNDVYKGNQFLDNGVGVAVMFSKNISMKDNLFAENWGGSSYGILLKEISDGEMLNNEFIRNTKAIVAEGVNRLLIRENTFTENGWAIDIKGNCLDNVIERNNFQGNTFELTTNSKTNSNTFRGNYWSHYQGYDLNRDGIGDIPHRPVRLFALLVEKVPAASIMLHSMVANALDFTEKVFPNLVPELLIDDQPQMKPITP